MTNVYWSCLNLFMPWDPLASAHLELLAGAIDTAGVTDHLRTVVQQLWRANVDRFDPDAIYDDSSTLGYTAARNVSNRMHAELRGPNGALRPAAFSVWENQSTVIRVGSVDVRLVKARVDRGRSPRFMTDFRWENREGRLVPAARNAARYAIPSVSDEMDPLFEMPVLDAKDRIALCTDVFMVWAGDLVGRTAGWYGLPTIGSGSWLAVQSAWTDEDGVVAPTERRARDSENQRFSELAEAKPFIALKPRSGIGESGV